MNLDAPAWYCRWSSDPTETPSPLSRRMGPPEMLNANDILRSKPAESAGPRCAGIPIFFRHQPEEIAWLISNVLSLSHQALPTLFLGTHHFPEELFTRQDVVLTHHRQSPLHLYYPYYLIPPP